MPDADRLPRAEFLDHVPALLDRLADRLRGLPADAGREGQQHGGHRWRQGYDIAEVVTELGHLRTALRRRHRRVRPRRTAGTSAGSSRPWPRSTRCSTRPPPSRSASSRRTAGRETRQALAEVKARQRSIEEAWVAAKLERAKLRTVLRSLPVAVWVADAEGTIIGTNAEAERMQGFDPPTTPTRPTSATSAPSTGSPAPTASDCPADGLPIVRALRGEVVIQEEYVWAAPRRGAGRSRSTPPR